MRRRYLYQIQQHADWFAINFEVGCHGDECLVVWRGPRVRGKVQLPIMLLEHLCYTFPDIHEDTLDVSRYCCGRRYVVIRPSGFHQTLKPPVLHYIEGPFTFRYPSDDLGPVDKSTQSCRYTFQFMDAPRFGFHMLPMGERNLVFAFPLERGRYRLRIQESFDCGCAYLIRIISNISGSNHFITPTLLCMLSHVTR